MEVVNFVNITPVLIILGIAGGFGFWNLIKHFEYELNFRESLLFPILILILEIVCLTDLGLLNIDEDFKIVGYGIGAYFLILLVSYYVIRTVKLKKYIPTKVILAYVGMSVVYFVCLAIPLLDGGPNNHIDGWDGLGLFIFFAMFCVAYLIVLGLVNIVLLIIVATRRSSVNFKNIKYNFSRACYLNILAGLVIVGTVFGINYYNGMNYDKMLDRQRGVVMDYLHKEYPDSEFEIVRMHETCAGGFMFSCYTQVIRNEVLNKTTNDAAYRCLQVDVRKRDLTIHDADFIGTSCNNK